MIDPERANEIAMEMATETTFKVFSMYRKAGFTRREALELTKINLAASLQRGITRGGK
ncbi:hypothetical protein [Streptomyces sp. NPDC057854]|uniref:hypothetical protein n=1 Tax=unclassified Streptomyces TaxID=2593676 RepID=UPI00368A5D61